MRKALFYTFVSLVLVLGTLFLLGLRLLFVTG